MVADQKLTPYCLCGHKIFIFQNQNTRRCPECHALWTRDSSGFWASRFNRIIFTPKMKFLAKRGA